MTSRTTIALAVLVALGIAAGTAYATTSRADYVAQADPICLSVKQPVDNALARYVKAKRKAKAGQLGAAKVKLLRSSARIFGGVTARISKIAPPTRGRGDRLQLAQGQGRGTQGPAVRG